MPVNRYRKKPVEIEAIQLKWETWGAVCDFLDGIINKDNPGRYCQDPSDTCGATDAWIEITIPTLEGNHTAKHGDYIIKGISGEFYPCKPEIFEKTYEVVS